MNKIIVVGSINIDNVVYTKKVPIPGTTEMGESFMSNIGGKGANQACAIHFLETPVMFVGAIGNDPNGEKVKKYFDSINLNNHLFVKTAPTGSAHIWCETVKGENQIITIPGANEALTISDMKEFENLIETNDILLLQLEIPIDCVLHLIKCAKNIGAKVVLNPAPYHFIDNEYLKYIDYFIPNEHELDGFIPGEESYEHKAKTLLKLGVQNVIVTLGEKGSLFVNNQETINVPPNKVNVVDTTCAGDSYCGAFSSYLLKGKSIKECLKFASLVSSKTVTKKGAISSLPHIQDL